MSHSAIRPRAPQVHPLAQRLARTRRQWGRQVRHVWDRGFATSQWLTQGLETNLRFVLRWPKRYTLLDGAGEQCKAWEIARGKRTWDTRQLYDTRTRTRETVGVRALPVTHPEHARPLWLVIARSKCGREPWYLLTSDVVRTPEQPWAIVFAYPRRWQIEQTWRYSKSELGCESPRVWKWERREKLLLMLSVLYAFLLHLLVDAYAILRADCLRWGCHRTGKRSHEVTAPLYRLRAAASRLLTSYPGSMLSASLTPG